MINPRRMALRRRGNEIACNDNMLVAESQYSVHTRAVKERLYSSTAVRPVLFSKPSNIWGTEQFGKSDYLESIRIMSDISQRQRQWFVLEHGTHSTRDQSAKEDEDDFMELNGEFYLNTCVLPARHEPCYSPCAAVLAQACCSTLTSSRREVAEQIEGDRVGSDTAFTEAHNSLLAEDLLSEDAQVYNLNDVFDSLQSTFPPMASPVQNKSPDLEGRSVPGEHLNALLLKPSIMKQRSGFGGARKRTVTEAGEVTESRVFRRKYLVTERSEGTDPRVSPSSAVPNYNNGEIDIINMPRGNDIDEDEVEPQGMRLKPESGLENIMEFKSHYVMLKNLRIRTEAGFQSDVQHEQQKDSKDVGDLYSVAGNYEDLYKPGDEVLLKTMGWFPVEEYPNEDNDPYAVRWILDEPPSASDLPHLESLLESSPSKFWSPVPESRKRLSARFGYLCCSETSQSSHSIRYFVNDSPASSPEVTGTMLHRAPDVRISRTEPSHQYSPACPNFHGTAQDILTPARIVGKPTKASMKSPSLGSDRKLAAQVQEGVPEMSHAFSEDSSKKNTASSERSMASPVHQDRSHYQETGSVANLTALESAARRLQRGKNLVTDFLKIGTTQEKIEARLIRNDIEHTDTPVQPSSTLPAQVENATLSSTKMRRKCPPELPAKERENSLLSLELQNLHGGDGNCFMKRDSSLLRPLFSTLKTLDQLQGDPNYTREINSPSVALSDISNHPDSATGLRNSLVEKDGIASQLLFAKPVSESLGNEHLVTVKCPEVTHDNIAWSATGVLRVSRKRSSRIRKPKLKGVEALNRVENGEVAQSVRTTPKNDYYTSIRRKSLTPKRSTFEELPRNVKLRHLEFASTSDCETDLRRMPMQGGTSPARTPTLTRIVKPLRFIKTSPSKGITCIRIKPILRSTMGLPTELRKVKPLQFVKNSPVKHFPDVSKAVLTSEKNPGVSGEAPQRHEVKEESFSKLSVDCGISKNPALRSSKYRGVTRHRHTGRYEAHLWDNSRMKLGLAKRGTQVYLGAYPDEDQAAKAHDLAALKYWGPGVYTNFPPSLYEEELRTVENLTKEQYVTILRRRSPGFTRGISKYRGVTRHHQEGRWEARIGRHSGAKYHYLGTYDTQEEAAAAYDRAAVRHRGIKAITNFDISNYIKKSPKAHEQ